MESKSLHNCPPAGLARRLLAGVYDWLLVLAIMMVLSVPVVALTDDAVSVGNNLYRFGLIVVAGAFFVGFWARGGQTLGMRAWRLRLVNPDGARVGPGPALLRYMCAWVSLLPAGMGFWWALLDRDKCAWHDRWSGTRLILLPKNKD